MVRARGRGPARAVEVAGGADVLGHHTVGLQPVREDDVGVHRRHVPVVGAQCVAVESKVGQRLKAVQATFRCQELKPSADTVKS